MERFETCGLSAAVSDLELRLGTVTWNCDLELRLGTALPGRCRDAAGKLPGRCRDADGLAAHKESLVDRCHGMAAQNENLVDRCHGLALPLNMKI